MKQLDAYLSEQGTRQSEFAERIGVSKGYLSELRAGIKRPSLDLAFVIERATDGEVTAESWTAPAKQLGAA